MELDDMKMCPIWGLNGHNYIVFYGRFLFWRRYKHCVACGYEERVI